MTSVKLNYLYDENNYEVSFTDTGNPKAEAVKIAMKTNVSSKTVGKF